MLKRLCLTAILALTPITPALAQTCQPPDVTDSFNTAGAREETFVMVVGELVRTGPETLLPDEEQTASEGDPASYTFPGQFLGRVASANGFVDEVDVSVTVDVTCTADGCGAPPLETYALFFLRRDATRLVFEANPCDPFSYENPTEEELLEVIGCALGEACGPAE
ncbi:hypothetical protein E2K80_15370 [Rhodophyticola sp. CCM32]|uniref:hypothetical protein n=1 Tax=Rhodophyticola sp. CCM32 TaxID=2916397 RepID=UPI00107F51D4|nr:hypothetical protein [Rhodophyticola sp. CCM32]QBY01932.1 hypothetical protein E2K80_15370 [Rhodophyticola sp. CCM32]